MFLLIITSHVPRKRRVRVKEGSGPSYPGTKKRDFYLSVKVSLKSWSGISAFPGPKWAVLTVAHSNVGLGELLPFDIVIVA